MTEPARSTPVTQDPEMAAIPTCESVRTVTMTHRFGDLYNPPGLTNHWGAAQAALDVTAVRSLAFPPLAQGEQVSGLCDVMTGILYVGGRYHTGSLEPISLWWQPDTIERSSRAGDLELVSSTIVPFGHTSVAVRLRVRNAGAETVRTEVKLGLRGGVTRNEGPWTFVSPGEFDNEVQVLDGTGAVAFTSRYSGAAMVQGARPLPDRIDPTWIAWDVELAPGAHRELVFAVALGDGLDAAIAHFEASVSDFDALAAQTRREWDAELEAAFTPGNDRFSGHLPRLVTTDESLRRLYHTALITVLFCKRTTPSAFEGPTYITLAPRYWQTATFLWDASLTAMLLAMLDPVVLRRMVEKWMRTDIHRFLATDYLTGRGLGAWYSVNDFAMCRMASEYLRWTGDHAWLDEQVGDETVLEHLVGYATYYRRLVVGEHGLADYGGVWNLLEAVGSYVHEVASLNAANVWCLRFVADLLERRGRDAEATQMRTDAQGIVDRLSELYIPSRGCWNVRHPDGRTQEVGHCYDFGTVLWAISDDLEQHVRDGMVWFLATELQTPTWMRALSLSDPDVTYSVRPDHQWTGAYAAWPAIALTGLYRAGYPELARKWLPGLAKTAEQGPIAQAHFAESAVDPEHGGGARKAPSDLPWINDWACVSGGAYLESILTGPFGVRAGLFGELHAEPHLEPGVRAELHGLRYQGRDFDVRADGATPSA
ncbi:MAG TPA: hypothetical protein VM840_07180 [Actinomycetota bacterium]|nr:hypothetical protein [Actinomycetota bacterium]